MNKKQIDDKELLEKVRAALEQTSNEVVIGNISLKSSREGIPALIKHALSLLDDEKCKDYLHTIKRDLLRTQGYFG